ncbi:hypothetical protein SmJEL517_g06100 [Synchytrium microbalum]|uniref:Uncharacterized protein n=1 Tax=Synchytrium microbalum TaxID=1806994 RepID=A0A507BHE8_9FUNG|nr:uncharacterized protein SmJEL517_g06100 [Synchytrium microbalum]TPX30310.1 hypothetical protein SmJEL517_g06100 [Synchytrium microbalum]
MASSDPRPFANGRGSIKELEDKPDSIFGITLFQGVLTTVLGDGQIDQHELQRVASFGPVFMSKDFQEAISLVISGKTSIEEVKLRTCLLHKTNSIANRVAVQVELKDVNTSKETFTAGREIEREGSLVVNLALGLSLVLRRAPEVLPTYSENQPSGSRSAPALVISIHSRVIIAIRNVFSTAALLPEESQLSKQDRDRFEEWIDDDSDSRESKAIVEKYLNYLDHIGVSHDEDDFLESLSGFGLAVNLCLAKLNRASAQTTVVLTVSPSEMASVDETEVNDGHESDRFTEDGSVINASEFDQD